MLDKNMLVDDGWQVYEPFRHSQNAVSTVRIAKNGTRLYLSAAAWKAMGSPEVARVLWDKARCRIAIEPAKPGDDLTYQVRPVDNSPRRELQFSSLARSLGLEVERTTTVPHGMDGFRMIVDLRGLRAKGGAE